MGKNENGRHNKGRTALDEDGNALDVWMLSFTSENDDCGCFVWPSSNEEYWHRKIDRNVERDANNNALLKSQGWTILTIWECQLKRTVAEKHLQDLYEQIIQSK